MAIELQQEIARRISTEVSVFLEGITQQQEYPTRVWSLERFDQSQLSDILNLSLAYNRAIESITLLDREGIALISVARVAISAAIDQGVLVSDDAMQMPLESAEVYYGLVRFDQNSSEPLMTISVPYLDLQSGITEGVLVAEVRIKSIGNLIAETPKLDGASIYIVDSQNRVVFIKIHQLCSATPSLLSQPLMISRSVCRAIGQFWPLKQFSLVRSNLQL